MSLLLLLLAAAPGETMVQLPGGRFAMGVAHNPHVEITPAHEVTLSPFSIDATLVTVADFRRFVEATGHRTSAEKMGWGMTALEGMKDWEWRKVEGASWRQPWGPEHVKDLPVSDDWPVVMVSWLDADAYCKWRKARLPTEAEWEYAMRAGSQSRYPWGDGPQLPDGGYGLNFWQGGHEKNERADGFVYLSPVKAFPPNAFGIYDPVGNVWQWTADWYAPDTYSHDAAGARDPKGPAEGEAKVARGGSWWCSHDTCNGYGVYRRGKTKPDAPYSNNGFRCARSR
ncbi:MAG: formylglycine-generating enzyme family protein [Myxococcaceae bacterium]